MNRVKPLFRAFIALVTVIAVLSGSAVEVSADRRSPSFDPARSGPRAGRREVLPRDIPNCLLWLRGDLGVTKDGSNKVSAWADLCGAGNNATQATGAAQPLYEATGFNGLPSVKTDGAATYLIANAVATTLSGSNKPWTLFVAGQFTSVVSCDAVSLTSSSSDSPFFSLGSNGTSVRVRRRDDASTSVVLNNPAANTSAHVFVDLFPGTTNSLWVDNAVRSGDPNAMSVGTMTVNRFTIGALGLSSAYTSFSPTRFAEIIVIGRAVTSSERITIQYYLSKRYGVTLSMALPMWLWPTWLPSVPANDVEPEEWRRSAAA